MSRSYKKHPHCGYVRYSSNKKDKKLANRKFRSANKHIIKTNMSYNKTIYPDQLDDDWWEEYPIEQLDNADFKHIREVSDTWDFSSDGLWPVTAEWERVWDNSIPFDWKNRINHPRITIAEARRTHNWETLKHFISK